MAFNDQITKHMHVKNSGGETIGVVDDVEGDRIKMTAKDSTDGHHHYVPISDVTRVDEHVHLRTSGLAPGSLAAAGVATGAGAAATHAAVHDDDDRESGGLGKILPWILAGLVVIFGVLWLSGLFDKEEAVAPPVDVSGPPPVVIPGIGTLGVYLGGTGEVPRTFVFDTLNFDTGSSTVRDEDKTELGSVTAALKQYATTKVRVIGYADARGAEPANAELGKARADAVKAALVASGIASDRIETASGGEDAPADTNATAGGRAENRRTELVVVSR